MKQQQNVPIDSDWDVTQLKEGDSLFTVEFAQENGKATLITKELVFVKYLTKETHIEGIEPNDNAVLAELKDPKFEKTAIQTDIRTGFWKSAADAGWAFVKFSEELYKTAFKVFHEQFGQYEEKLGIKRS